MSDADLPVPGFAGALVPGLTTGGGLSVGEHAALAGVALVPVRPVVVALVQQLGPSAYECGSWYAVAGRPAWSPFRQTTDDVVEVPALRARLEAAFDAVLTRLVLACRAAGGDGVLGVVVEQTVEQHRSPMPPIGPPTQVGGVVVRLRLTGTVVRSVAPPAPPPPPAWLTDPSAPLTLVPRDLPATAPPWTTQLSGTEVAVALRAGLAPTSLAWGLGVAMVHGPTGLAAAQRRQRGGRICADGPMPPLTDLLAAARRQAREALPAQTLLTSSTVDVLEHEPFEAHRHTFAVATCLGSVLGGSAVGSPPPLTMLPLR